MDVQNIAIKPVKHFISCAEAILRQREIGNRTQKWVADTAGITRRQVQYIEQGKGTIENLVKVLNALDLNLLIIPSSTLYSAGK